MLEATATLPPPTERHRRGPLVVALGVIVLLVALCCIVHTATRVDEPVYRGKRLSVWLADTHWISTGQTVLSPAATQAVQVMGTNALPYLLYMMRSNDSNLKMKAAMFVWRYLHIDITMHFNDQKKAMFGFHALGAVAKSAYPELVRLVLATDNAGEPINALADADSDSIALVADGLHSPDVKVRRRAAFALGFLWKTPTVCIPALTHALNDPDLEVQTSAATWIGHYGPAANCAVPALARLTNSADVRLRLISIGALEAINVRSTNQAAK